MIDKNMMKEIGLSKNEIDVYSILLDIGEVGIKEIISNTKLNRMTIYNILNSLKEKKLIDESKYRGKKTFLPKSPLQLDSLYNDKIKVLQASQIELQKVLPDILMEYQLNSKTPLITSFKGLEGLKNIYNHVSSTRKTLYIFASHFDRTTKEFSDLINAQIKRQGRLKIKSKALTSLDTYSAEYWFFAKKNYVQMKTIDSSSKLPAQILIYGSNVAFTAFKGEYISTLISNEAIAVSLKTIFDIMWQNAKMPKVVKMNMQIKK